jgi:hypothetical protein
VTTILKAFRELEGRKEGAEAPAAASPREGRSLRWRPIRRVLLALTAGLLGGVASLSVRAALKSAPVPAQPRVAPRPSSAPLLLAAPAKDEAPRDAVEAAGPAHGPVVEEEAPWGRVEKRTATASAPAQLAPTVLRADAEPAPRHEPPVAADSAVGAVPRAAPSESRVGAREAMPHREASLRPPGQESPAAPVDRGPSRPSGDLRVQVTSIAYSPNVTERSATLRIGGQVVRLHQGESASGLEVQLILPDSVYLRRGGDIFAVDARR